MTWTDEDEANFQRQKALAEHEKLHIRKGNRRHVSPLWEMEEKIPSKQRRRSLTDFDEE